MVARTIPASPALPRDTSYALHLTAASGRPRLVTRLQFRTSSRPSSSTPWEMVTGILGNEEADDSMTNQSLVTNIASPETVLAFWREAGPDKWFTRDDAFDAD